MWARRLATVVMVLTSVGIVPPGTILGELPERTETIVGEVTELTASKVTVRVRNKDKTPSEAKSLTFAAKNKIVRLVGSKEETMTLAMVQAQVTRLKATGVPARLTLDRKGMVEKLGVLGGLPQHLLTMFEKAEEIELYSLEPDPRFTPADAKKFHGWPILGKTVIKAPKAKQVVIDTVSDAFERGDRAKCFDPRHGLRMVQGGKTLDLVICFACSQVYCHEGKEVVNYSISKSAQPALDKLLKDAEVPLARTSK